MLEIIKHSEVSPSFLTRIEETLQLIPPRVMEHLVEMEYSVHVGAKMADLVTGGPTTDVAGYCVFDEKAILIPETAVFSNGKQQVNDIERALAHEVGHALDHCFDFTLSTDPDFVKAYQADLPMANTTLKLAKQYPQAGVADNILEIQLSNGIGPLEVFANHFTHIVLGIPYANLFPISFARSLKSEIALLNRMELLEGMRPLPSVTPTYNHRQSWSATAQQISAQQRQATRPTQALIPKPPSPTPPPTAR